MEIERKFLVKELPALIGLQNHYIEQKYLSFEPEVRIRKKGCLYYLTTKSNGKMERQEYETEISKDTYEELSLKSVVYSSCNDASSFTIGKAIRKTRYYLPLEDSLVAEIDLYKDFYGLKIVEVEFGPKDIGKAMSFIPPDWFGKEVTDNDFYKNQNLYKQLNGIK